MKITGKISVKPPREIIKNHGLARGGDVQRFHTANAIRRIEKYMPYRSSMLIKLMIAQSPPSEPFIVIDAPQARYLYYGKVMVDAETGKGPANIPGVGLRFRRGAILRATDRDLDYDKSKNPLAGPFWDRRLLAAERGIMQKELQDYVNGRGAGR